MDKAIFLPAAALAAFAASTVVLLVIWIRLVLAVLK